MANHWDETKVHRAHNWSFDNAADRIAGTITGGGAGAFTADDVTDKKIALQLSDFSFWVITNHSPLAWEQINGAALLQTFLARRLAKTSAYTVVASDKGALINATTGTWTLTLTASLTLGDGFAFAVFNSGSGTITIDADGTETIRDATSSATTKALTQGEAAIIMCDGSGFLMMKIAVGGTGLTNPMTTQGDLIVGGTSGTPDRIAAGATSGHVLTSNGAGVAPSWQAASGGGGSSDIRQSMLFN